MSKFDDLYTQVKNDELNAEAEKTNKAEKYNSIINSIHGEFINWLFNNLKLHKNQAYEKLIYYTDKYAYRDICIRNYTTPSGDESDYAIRLCVDLANNKPFIEFRCCSYIDFSIHNDNVDELYKEAIARLKFGGEI